MAKSLTLLPLKYSTWKIPGESLAAVDVVTLKNSQVEFTTADPVPCWPAVVVLYPSPPLALPPAPSLSNILYIAGISSTLPNSSTLVMIPHGNPLPLSVIVTLSSLCISRIILDLNGVPAAVIFELCSAHSSHELSSISYSWFLAPLRSLSPRNWAGNLRCFSTIVSSLIVDAL